MVGRVRSWSLVALLVCGCSRDAEIKEPEARLPPSKDPPIVATSPPDTRPSASTATPEPSIAPVAPRAASTPPPFSLTELAPTQGELLPLLRVHVELARTKQLRALVEFYADWCPPCRAFQESLTDSRMIEALRGVYIVKVNLDDWHDKLKDTGFVVRSIPRFYLLGDDGRPTGKMLDGDAWGKSTPANMSAALTKLLAR